MRQYALTLITTIKPAQVELLRSTLYQLSDSVKQKLRALGTVHYGRFVIIDETNLDGQYTDAQLIYTTNADVDPDKHIADICATMSVELDAIYAFCNHYQTTSRASSLRAMKIPEMAFYQGSPGRTVAVIEQEKALYDFLWKIKQDGNWKGQSAIAVHQQLRKAVLSNPNFDWVAQPVDVPKINWLGLVIFGIVQLAVAPFIILWAIYMQLFHEQFDTPLGLDINQLSDEHITTMQRDEDFHFQNQFSQVIDMKPGKARLFTVNLLYFITRILIKLLFVKGKLMGIPTIHFARWVMINDKKRMFFESNFDGSWTQYLGDFIDKSGWGLTGIFGNTKGFPRALLLILKGAYNQQKFLAWSRHTQIATQIWFAYDPEISIKNINNNTVIRNLLPKNLNEKEATKLLALI
ncbi:MAG: hypothetical protein JNM95_02470 [Chitinophagaceae bacterium]|nr:hypothetical protein [Chitinophagaceae bacterium]